MVGQAVVLCAGRGTRLGELTANQAKSMIPIAGKPLIVHIVDRLLAAGFSEIILVVGYRGDQLEELFQRNPAIRLARQASPAGTADAVLAAEELLDERFFLAYGDLWFSEADCRNLLAVSRQDQRQWLGVNVMTRPRGAAVYVSGDRVTGIVEKPSWPGDADTHLNACGLYVLSRKIVDDCRRISRSVRGELELTAAIQHAIDRGAVFSPYTLVQPHFDVGVPERYRALCSMLNPAPGIS